jgi:hypothetical protein
VSTAYTCIYCGDGNARTPVGNRMAHKACKKAADKRGDTAATEPPIAPIPTRYRTVLAAGAPWPFPVSASSESMQ